MKYKTQKSLLAISLYGVMVLFGVVFVIPILFMAISSLKPTPQLLRDTSSLRAFLPVGDISFQNYIDAFQRAPIVNFTLNSIFVTLTTVVLGLIVNSMAGFSIAIMRWKGQEILLSVIIATFIMPFETIAIPLLMVVSRLPWIGPEGGITYGWLNSYQVQIIPFIIDAFSIYLFVQFFKGSPRELIEAARIDGASWFTIYRKVILPLSGPVITTAAILRGMNMWNQYLWPILTIQSEKYRPVMVGIDYFYQTSSAGGLPWGEMMAYLSLITVPILIMFVIFQRAFVQSISTTGIKG
jgi:multiple sugar transport system permease protein